MAELIAEVVTAMESSPPALVGLGFTRAQLIAMRQGLLLQLKVLDEVLGFGKERSCTRKVKALESARQLNRQ